jgi:hypothetical protein
MKVFLVILQVFFLLGITVFLQFSYFIRPDEYAVLKTASIVKHNIFGSDWKPVGDSIRLINTSHDVSLIDDPEFLGNSKDSSAKIVITDRQKLARLFHILNEHPLEYKYILCDIQFSDASPQDTMLKPEIEKAIRCIASSSMQDHHLTQPIFNLKNGCTSYPVADDDVLVKVPVFIEDTIKSLPVAMYEELTKHQFIRRGKFPFLDGKPAFGSIIPEMYYRPHDIEMHDTSSPYLLNLWQVLIDPNAFEHLLKNKYIIIGDFKADAHNTYYGNIPGPLILFNTFLTLKERSDTISLWWVLFLFVVYSMISYRVVFRNHNREIVNKVFGKNRLFGRYIAKFISYLGIFICISLVSYFIFKRFVSVFYIVSYLTLVDLLMEKWPAIKSFELIKLIE